MNVLQGFIHDLLDDENPEYYKSPRYYAPMY